MNISLLLQMAADAEPARTALTCEGRNWSYSALWEAARCAAERFRDSGCGHVALLDTGSEAAALALFGAAIAGLPYVPLNYRLAPDDLSALLGRIAPAYVVGDKTAVQRLGSGGGHIAETRQAFVAAVAGGMKATIEAAEDASAIAVQLFTSGTTAAPKAAILRHANLVSYILGTVEFAAAEPEEAALVSVPPYHIAGIAALLSSIYALRRIILLPSFDADGWIDACVDEGATNAFLVPTMLSRVIARLDERPPAEMGALRAIAYGGGRMPMELIARALDLFPTTGFTNAYGLTETSSTIALLGPDEHRAAHGASDPAARRRLGSVGRPLPTVELQIRDEDGRVLPPGQAGEVYVRGEQVSGEYRERSALDAEGWFPTRDAGFLDEEGYLHLSGRADDVIVRGGENISPSEIEEVLIAHAAIADVAAVGAPSIEWGEAVVVAIVPHAGATLPLDDELRTMVRTRLRSSRVPERILVVDALPYNEMGKLLRREVKRLFLQPV